MSNRIPPRLTIRSAAKWCTVSERTLRRMTTDGRLSMVQDKSGKKYIETAELDRLGLLGLKRRTSAAPPLPQERLQGEIEDLRQQLEIARQRVSDLSRERDRAVQQADAWQKQANQLVAALTAAPVVTAASAETEKRTFWQWLRGA